MFLGYFQVFKPPNPWTMSIMNVLAELHQEPDLKLNLKFEIEVLCKNLNIDVVVSNCIHFCCLSKIDTCSPCMIAAVYSCNHKCVNVLWNCCKFVSSTFLYTSKSWLVNFYLLQIRLLPGTNEIS
jgi:hypothetical protein